MLGHYVTVALRNVRRSPISSAVNIIALALGLACFVVAYAVVNYWEQGERQFANADRIYVVTTNLDRLGASFPATAAHVAKYLEADFPEFEAVGRFRTRDTDDMGAMGVSTGGYKTTMKSAYADAGFLHIFNLPFVAGDAKEALTQPGSIVLTAEAAKRLFGDGHVIGQRLRIDNLVDATVSGVIGPLAAPSHLNGPSGAGAAFDVLASWDIHDRTFGQAGELVADDPRQPGAWIGGDYTTYVLLSAKTPQLVESLQGRLKDFVARHVPAELLANFGLSFGLLPVNNLMVEGLSFFLFSGTDLGLKITTLLLLLGGLVLVVACLNYANIATALAAGRTKEVGLRKAIGASPGRVMAQSLIEAGLHAATSLALAMATVALIVPALNATTGIDLSLSLFAGLQFLIFVAALIGGVTVLAGAYPAFILSRLRPLNALGPVGIRVGHRFVPTLLVGVQFLATSFLLVAVIVMFTQNRELRRTGLSATKDPLVVITNLNTMTGVDPETLRRELLRIPQVKTVAGNRELPWSLSINTLRFSRPEDTARIGTDAYFERVGYDYFSTLDMKLLAGRLFDRTRGGDVEMVHPRVADPVTPVSMVVDRDFATQIGFETPERAVNQIVAFSMGGSGGPARPARIIGVVETKPMRFMGMGAGSSVFFLGASPRFQVVRLAGGDVAGALQAIEMVWDKLSPDVPLELSFMDTLFDQSYGLFESIHLAFTGLALFAFTISTIGLFGMAIHVAGRRTREIGVRKTLGASTGQIVAMLLKDFSKPVLVANLLAWPLGFLAARMYLNLFVHRIPLTPVPFIASLAITLAVAWVAVGGQATRAARRKPAAALRYE